MKTIILIFIILCLPLIEAARKSDGGRAKKSGLSKVNKTRVQGEKKGMKGKTRRSQPTVLLDDENETVKRKGRKEIRKKNKLGGDSTNKRNAKRNGNHPNHGKPKGQRGERAHPLRILQEEDYFYGDEDLIWDQYDEDRDDEYQNYTIDFFFDRTYDQCYLYQIFYSNQNYTYNNQTFIETTYNNFYAEKVNNAESIFCDYNKYNVVFEDNQGYLYDSNISQCFEITRFSNDDYNYNKQYEYNYLFGKAVINDQCIIIEPEYTGDEDEDNQGLLIGLICLGVMFKVLVWCCCLGCCFKAGKNYQKRKYEELNRQRAISMQVPQQQIMIAQPVQQANSQQVFVATPMKYAQATYV